MAIYLFVVILQTSTTLVHGMKLGDSRFLLDHFRGNEGNSCSADGFPLRSIVHAQPIVRLRVPLTFEDAKNEKQTPKSLPEIAYHALKEDKFQSLQPHLMTLERYKQLYSKVSDRPKPTEEEMRQAGERAASSAKRWFHLIRDKLQEEEGFDWSAARLESIRVRSATDPQKWVDYSATDQRIRLAVYLFIISGKLRAVIKLDDCFLVNGQRYLGDGFKLYSLRSK